jgi:hypothetical protein
LLNKKTEAGLQEQFDEEFVFDAKESAKLKKSTLIMRTWNEETYLSFRIVQVFIFKASA